MGHVDVHAGAGRGAAVSILELATRRLEELRRGGIDVPGSHSRRHRSARLGELAGARRAQA